MCLHSTYTSIYVCCRRSHGQRISVCVRKRPQTHTERRRGEADVVTTPSRDCVIVHECKESVDLTQYILQHRFYFDQVFGEECSNEEVYQGTAYPLVQHMLNGGRATCFAYGQTGSGKTFTMLGSSPTRPGLYALAIRDIFAHLSSTHTNSPLLVYVSLFEIYCGQLYDLLDHRKRLYAREDGQKVVHIAGLRDVRVDSVSSLLEVIAQGTEERTQGVSGVNPHSSRSHALLQIQLKDRNQRVSGRMWFVDLAGSERASDTKDPDRQSRMEGAEINQSLLALKECIRSLDQEQSHTPFRQSKLTQVLKDSFVGDSMTCMIANISPGHLATEHTLNTLRYADRVKELKGQRGERRGKTVSYQSSMSKSSRTGGVNIRGKSPPKKPKLGRQREAFVPTSSSTRHTGGPVLCSTPKNTRNSKKTSTRDRKDISLEQISPIRGSLGTGDKRKRAGRKEGRGREIYVETDSVGHSGGDQNASGSWSYHHHRALQEDREEERRLITERGPTQSSRYSCTGAESVKEGDLGEDKEKEMHLRRYHQQLQQFTPSSASSSLHLLSPSIPSSNPASLSSSVSPSSCSSLLHASHLSDSVLTYQGLKEVLDAVGAKVKVRTEACLHTKIKDEEGCGDSSGGDVRSSREAWRPAGMENIAERGWAWVTATEAEQTGGMTGVKPAALEAQMSYSRDSEQRKEVREEGLESSDVPTEGMWSNEEHESNEGSSSFTHPIVESYSHQAPAERPLSPGCEHTQTSLTSHELMELPFRFRRTSNNLHLTSQNSLMDAPTRRHSEKEHWFAANGDTREFSNAGLPQEDSVSHTMDPLSISLLEVDQQAATASFLQGGLITGPLYPLENETKEENRREVEKENRACLDMTVKAGLGTMKLSTPEVMPESLYDQDNQKPQLGLAINILGNKTYASTPSSGSLIKQTSANIQSISSSVQPCWKTGSPNPPKRKMNGATQTTPQTAQQMHNEFPPSVSISPAGSVLGLSRTLPKQGHTVPSIPSNNSNISLQPTIWRESNFQGGTSNQKTPNMINLPMLEDTDHAKWRVIQAHWEQLEEMEALWHKEGALLCQQPDMVFSEYVHKLEEIMTKKAKCVNNMIAQLRPYLGPCYSNQAKKHNKEDNHDAT
ncbi:kinesin-like protein KIF24 isoform X1 [Xyrichtys novacula]|uniref:Kinesin-like protein KIF24 isoform X1 n=1 Tax=Xyrichtys novacula TaxID=13765 RepID=A0AAV1G6V2_XYRNO|nr:kinesin-like protein KIF24 isoform X1 [Xyrichtys novacula]